MNPFMGFTQQSPFILLALWNKWNPVGTWQQMDDLKIKSLQLALIFGSGLSGAFAARFIGLPIPFLLGSLVVTAALALTRAAKTGKPLFYPNRLRETFIGVIGTMIGTTFTPEILSMAPTLGITLSTMMVFVVLTQAANYAIFRGLGRYDRSTATYSAMPGGLIESVELGARAGADVETLTLQHFVRIVLVIITVPMLFLAVTGEAVGSAAGQSLERSPAGWQDWALIAILAPVGLLFGRWLGLPAAPLIGPLGLTAGLQATGIVDLQGPQILLNAAQLVVGASLGVRFANATPRRLLTAFGLGVVSIAVTLAIASALSLAIGPFVPISFQTLLISFSPGGVTEMSLVALSLGASPVLVSTHHVFRILFTVGVASLLARRVGNGRPKS